jgi:hypothetical protein
MLTGRMRDHASFAHFLQAHYFDEVRNRMERAPRFESTDPL